MFEGLESKKLLLDKKEVGELENQYSLIRQVFADHDCQKIVLITIVKHSYSSMSHYNVLDVPKTASHEEIKKAFFEKSKKV